MAQTNLEVHPHCCGIRILRGFYEPDWKFIEDVVRVWVYSLPPHDEKYMLSVTENHAGDPAAVAWEEESIEFLVKGALNSKKSTRLLEAILTEHQLIHAEYKLKELGFKEVSCFTNKNSGNKVHVFHCYKRQE